MREIAVMQGHIGKIATCSSPSPDDGSRTRGSFGPTRPPVPLWRSQAALELHPRVTFFVGENGSGKSTLLEAIAIAARLRAEGGDHSFHVERPRIARRLRKALRLAWRQALKPLNGLLPARRELLRLRDVRRQGGSPDLATSTAACRCTSSRTASRSSRSR